MDERKATIASNLIRLRLAAGMTQAEVGEKLNYSDKTISKWERGEVPTDVFLLMEIAALFDVSVDYLIKPHAEIEPIVYNKPQEPHYNTRAITAIAVSLVTALYLTFLQNNPWQIFLLLIPISAIVFLSFRIKKR